MSRKVWKAQLQLLTKMTRAHLTARQAFMANMLGNVRQLLRDLPLDRPLIEHTDEEIIALVRKVFRERRANTFTPGSSRTGRKPLRTFRPKGDYQVRRSRKSPSPKLAGPM